MPGFRRREQRRRERAASAVDRRRSAASIGHRCIDSVRMSDGPRPSLDVDLAAGRGWTARRGRGRGRDGRL